MGPEQCMVKEFHQKYGAPIQETPAQIASRTDSDEHA